MLLEQDEVERWVMDAGRGKQVDGVLTSDARDVRRVHHKRQTTFVIVYCFFVPEWGVIDLFVPEYAVILLPLYHVYLYCNVFDVECEATNQQ